MASMAREIAEGVAHHVTQARQRRVVFDADADRVVHLNRCYCVGGCNSATVVSR
jgi:hypothetical protein